MVTDDEALDAITTGPDGILAGLGPGKIYVDMSTVSPRASRALAERVARARRADARRAGLGQHPPGRQSGTLTIMVGGDEHAFATRRADSARARHAVTHVGANGQGLVLKLAINISLAVQMLAFSEGLLLAERDGVDPHRAADVMEREPDRLADAEGTRAADPRPAQTRPGSTSR